MWTREGKGEWEAFYIREEFGSVYSVTRLWALKRFHSAEAFIGRKIWVKLREVF